MIKLFLGYTGKDCETNINDCPGNLCQNGATCIDGMNTYTCHCPPSYTGKIYKSNTDFLPIFIYYTEPKSEFGTLIFLQELTAVRM